MKILQYFDPHIYGCNEAVGYVQTAVIAWFRGSTIITKDAHPAQVPKTRWKWTHSETVICVHRCQLVKYKNTTICVISI